MLRFWDHLDFSEILKTDLSGTGGVVSAANSPDGVLPSTLIVPNYRTDYFSRAGNAWNLMDESSWSAALSSQQAKNIDAKMDDGIANSGQIYGMDGAASVAGSCSAGFTSSGSGADYNLSTSGKACFLAFFFQL